jgi:hypothetical protein
MDHSIGFKTKTPVFSLRKSAKIGENRRKSAKIGENRKKIGENKVHNIDPWLKAGTARYETFQIHIDWFLASSTYYEFAAS